MFNLNFSNAPEYELVRNLTDELISMYGIQVKYITTEKVNLDFDTFGEWTSLKANANDMHYIYLLPNTQENYQGLNVAFDQFGLSNFSTAEFFVSERDVHIMFPNWETSMNFNDMISDLILMPSGKVMEVTHVEPLVEGVNNLFAYPDKKNTLKLTARNYTFRKADELELDSVTTPPEPVLTPEELLSQNNLDDYFTRLIDSDVIPDETYAQKPGRTSVLDYEMKIADKMYMTDTFTINSVVLGSTPIQTAGESIIIENSSSVKAKQDKVLKKGTKKPEVRPKSEEFSNPFGELG